MKNTFSAFASVTVPLMLLAQNSFAQNFPDAPYVNKPGFAGNAGNVAGVQGAYLPDYYTAPPGYRSGSSGYRGYSAFGTGSVFDFPNYAGLPALPMMPSGRMYGGNIQSLNYVIATSAPNVAAIDVKVPAGAKLWFQGQQTRQAGSLRYFESPQLEKGKTYAYHVKAEWTNEEGQKVERKRTVHVHAGEYLSLDLLKPAL